MELLYIIGAFVLIILILIGLYKVDKELKEKNNKMFENIDQVKIASERTKGCFTPVLICVLLAPFTLGISLIFALEPLLARNQKIYDFVIIYKDGTRKMKKDVIDKETIDKLLMYI